MNYVDLGQVRSYSVGLVLGSRPQTLRQPPEQGHCTPSHCPSFPQLPGALHLLALRPLPELPRHCVWVPPLPVQFVIPEEQSLHLLNRRQVSADLLVV